MSGLKFQVGDTVKFDGIGRGIVEGVTSYPGTGTYYRVKFRISPRAHDCAESELELVERDGVRAWVAKAREERHS